MYLRTPGYFSKYLSTYSCASPRETFSWLASERTSRDQTKLMALAEQRWSVLTTLETDVEDVGYPVYILIAGECGNQPGSRDRCTMIRSSTCE